MKNKFLLILPIILTSFLSSCGEENVVSGYTTFGKIYDSIAEVFNRDYDTSYDAFKQACNNKNSFVLITYNSYTCGCYVTFRNANKQYLFDNNIDVLTMDASNLENKETFGYKLNSNGYYPNICIFIDGEAKVQVDYSLGNDLFTSNEKFISFIDQYLSRSQLFLVSTEKFRELKTSNSSFLALYESETCGDCKNYLNRVLYPFVKANFTSLKEKFFYVVPRSNFTTDESWIEAKNEFGLSNVTNTKYGYDVGFVPTIQYIENSSITAMNVYLNDSFQDGKCVKSYYTSDMVSLQPYLNNKQNYIMQGKTASTESDLIETHDEIATSFLTKYFLNAK